MRAHARGGPVDALVCVCLMHTNTHCRGTRTRTTEGDLGADTLGTFLFPTHAHASSDSLSRGRAACLAKHGARVSRPRGTGSVGDSVGEGVRAG